jgi:hypothetical protein
MIDFAELTKCDLGKITVNETEGILALEAGDLRYEYHAGEIGTDDEFHVVDVPDDIVIFRMNWNGLPIPWIRDPYRYLLMGIGAWLNQEQ